MKKIKVISGKYADSITLMLIAEELRTKEGVQDAVLNMATPANLNIMKEAGFVLGDQKTNPDDLVIAIEVEEEKVDVLLKLAEEYLTNPPWKKGISRSKENGSIPTCVEDAVNLLEKANLSVISVTGRYAAVEAYKSLEQGLNVMLFSDNVSLQDEIALKTLAHDKGLLVMGPDCGTCVIGGIGLGFANHGKTGPVGILGASGTGIQEVYVQLQKRDIGVLHAIGTGGRDIKDEVGGISFLDGLTAIWQDQRIKIITVISKPLSPKMESKIEKRIQELNETVQKKPVVICFVGGKQQENQQAVYYCTDFEETALVVDSVLKGENLDRVSSLRNNVRKKKWEIFPDRAIPDSFLRGFYTGGTLCYEAQSIISSFLDEVYSNTPLKQNKKIADAFYPTGHCLIDYGEDEFTQGRLHPMIDPSLRNAQLRKQALHPTVGVVLFDVVLGYGCHPDPAEELAQIVRDVSARRKHDIIFICSVTGLQTDVQDSFEQELKLEHAGVYVCQSNAEAAFIAGMLLKKS